MDKFKRFYTVAISLSFLSLAAVPVRADWTMWRGDAARSASTADTLPDVLKVVWQRRLPPLTPAWTEDPRLHFDASYEPVAAHGMLYIASSRNDSLMAVDTTTGEEQWRFYAGGPIRFAPVISDGMLFFGADDGCFYCVDAKSGQQIWKFLAAPQRRKVLGNARLTSVWPVRGGAVLHQGRIWFSVGVWPFEGTFLYSFNVAGATTSTIRKASQQAEVVSIRQSGLPGLTVETLTDITPQGYLVATVDRIYVPCGRSKVLSKDLISGKLRVPNYSTGSSTSYHVSATDRFLFHGGVSVDMETFGMLPQAAAFPVTDDGMIYFGRKGSVFGHDLGNPREVIKKDRRGRDVKSTELDRLWELRDRVIHRVPPEPEYTEWIEKTPIRVDLKAGNRLYGHQGNQLFALELDGRTQAPKVVWNAELDATPRTMLPADGRLVVVAEDGTVTCYGAESPKPPKLLQADSELPRASSFSDTVSAVLEHSGDTAGYCLVAGIGSGGLIMELLQQSDLQIVAIDPDRASVERLRTQLDRAGIYGTRVSALVGDPVTAGLPPYFASLVVSETIGTGSLQLTDALISSLFHSTRPYGGCSLLPGSAVDVQTVREIVERLGLANAQVQRTGDMIQLARSGPLPGSADWTHEYGDPANTLMSHDELVKAPLGVLWFGGPSSSGRLFYNRHFWGPSMVVIGGRMFVQGPGNLAAIDVYTGRILWQKPLDDTENYRPGRRGNDFEGRLSGFNFMAVEDSLYLVLVDRCERLDPETGETVEEFRLPSDEESWGRVRVEDDLLIAEVFAETEELGLMPVAMAAMDRETGEARWRRDAWLSFPVSAVSGDTLYCFDGALAGFYKDWERKGLVPKAADNKMVVAIDLVTGEERWRVPTDHVLTWLAFSQDNDMLIASNKKSITAFRGTDGYMSWTKLAEGEGFRGHPETLWDKVILWGDQILDQRGPGRAYDIISGAPIERMHPMTRDSVEWEFTKTGHHCNYAIANPHLMTFRADTAGFCDIASGTTARLQGYRPGCRNSLIPANGVLNSPNFAHGCVCGYPLFTSLALVHRPDSELWTYSPATLTRPESIIRQLAINFGAPGDRQVEGGSLWLAFPSARGPSPDPVVHVQGDDLEYFRDHSSLITSDGVSWILGSGVEGASKVTLKLNNPEPQNYSINLMFRAPKQKEDAAERIFSVIVQGESRIVDLDIPTHSNTQHGGITHTLTDVSVTDELQLEFAVKKGRPVLCGLEVVATP